MWSRDYFDGLGRTWRKTSKGPAAGQDIQTDFAYNARGKIATQSDAYFTGGTVYNTTTSYDALDRVTRVTNPDNTYRTVSYGLLSATETDEKGRQVAYFKDVLGRLTRQREWIGGTAQCRAACCASRTAWTGAAVWCCPPASP